ncbi:MAG TPA: hypothetical protein VHV54_22470 [Candidatus Binatia bacterium]|nr:hypothetical protein [Candidatus Binatia bacterium]
MEASFHSAGEGGEDLTDFTGMFEPVIVAFSIAVEAHRPGGARPVGSEFRFQRVKGGC